MNTRAAREIRQAINDARARRFPAWFSCTAQGYHNAAQHPLYREAYTRTDARMPRPKPPRGGSGISRRTR